MRWGDISERWIHKDMEVRGAVLFQDSLKKFAYNRRKICWKGSATLRPNEFKQLPKLILYFVGRNEQNVVLEAPRLSVPEPSGLVLMVDTASNLHIVNS
jgi:hypothetical protein